MEALDDAKSAAEGALLANYKFQEYKETDKRSKLPEVGFAAECTDGLEDWQRGAILAKSQNFARMWVLWINKSGVTTKCQND